MAQVLKYYNCWTLLYPNPVSNHSSIASDARKKKN